MRTLVLLLLILLLSACSEMQAEEFAFRKALEHDLVKLCEKDKECIAAVRGLTRECMESSDWRKFLNNQNDRTELERFTKEFYACIVDSEGNPYFVFNS